ncbi:hypothetical protein [Stutzerimonas stutzeri]|uniref:hypothetical protein n=1 Tax=Stutzerimonas stutzeri TaxID=316 RepID=UPI0015E3381E|nr:hypothetical protein [Stutzerimonas stutzeri]MBA1280447.1 hypothetical protein [Stutzerimonas stutzeri]
METVDTLELTPTLYANKRIAFRLTCEDGEPYGALTCNIVDVEIEDDEICIPVWNLREELIAGYLATGQFEETGKGVETGFVVAPVWRVVCPKLLEQIARLRKQA